MGESEQKLEGQRAIARAMTTQVESLQRQVANLTSLQAENEALKSTVEVSSMQTLPTCDALCINCQFTRTVYATAKANKKAKL